MSIVELQNRVNELKAQLGMYKSKRSSGSNPGPTYGFYTKNKKVYQYEMTQAEADEHNKLMRKVRYAMHKAETEQDEAYELEHTNGYCPVCHMLLPMNSTICQNC